MRRVETIGSATLYLGNCREILPTLDDVACFLTDPPYGIRHKRGSSGNRPQGRHAGTVRSLGCEVMAGDSASFDPAPLLGRPAIIWGGDHFAHALPAGRWLVWDKTFGGGAGDFSHFEVAWSSDLGTRKIFRHLWMGVQRDSEQAETRLHPTQKPVALMSWCLRLLPASGTVCDPFMGSGTTGVACHRADRKFIGIEIESKYFDIACRRIEDASKQPDLFIEAPTAPIQEPLALTSADGSGAA